MTKEKNIITASCTISNSHVYKNGMRIFEREGLKASELLAGLYSFIAPDYPKFYKMDNLSKLGWLATEILLRDSFAANSYLMEDIGVVLCNSNASLDTDLRYIKTVSEYPSPSLFVYTLPNIVIGEICIRHKFQGENAFFVFDQFQPGFIHQYASGLLDAGVLKVCICGWVEILAESYRAAVFLVERKEDGLAFSAEAMQELYDL
jgi:hypothetical protein